MSAVNLKTLRGNTPAHVFVFRPGGVQGGNVYTGWTDLMVALDAADGPREIVFDDSITSPCVVPAGGPYDMTDVTWKGRKGGVIATRATIADGASFTNLLVFDQIAVQNASTTSPMTLTDRDMIWLSNNCDISQAGAGFAPMFDGSALGLDAWVFVYTEFAASIGGLVWDQTVIDMGGSAATLLTVHGLNCVIYGTTISGGAAAILSTIISATSGFLHPQPTFLGTFTQDTQAGPQFNQVPGRGIVPSIISLPALDAHPYDWLRLNANAGSFTQTMPRIVSVGTGEPFNDGRVCIVSETGGVNGITLDGYLDETIDGAATFTLPPGATVQFISDGVSNWTSVRSNRAQVTRIINTDSPYTVLANDRVIFCDTDGGAIEVDLPAGIKGTNYKIINTGSSGNDVTVDGNAAEEIYGALTQLLSDGEVVDLHFETTEGWW